MGWGGSKTMQVIGFSLTKPLTLSYCDEKSKMASDQSLGAEKLKDLHSNEL